MTIYARSIANLAGTWMNELGYVLDLRCGGVRHPPPKADFGGTVARCRCERLPSTDEVVSE